MSDNGTKMFFIYGVQDYEFGRKFIGMLHDNSMKLSYKKITYPVVTSRFTRKLYNFYIKVGFNKQIPVIIDNDSGKPIDVITLEEIFNPSEKYGKKYDIFGPLAYINVTEVREIIKSLSKYEIKAYEEGIKELNILLRCAVLDDALDIKEKKEAKKQEERQRLIDEENALSFIEEFQKSRRTGK